MAKKPVVKSPQSEYSQQSVLLEDLVKQMRQNFYVMKSFMERLGAFDELGRWGSIILGILCRGEPCAIPHLQEALPLSRQYIQKEVAKLQALNLIEAVDNPAHKTSKLLRATKHGRSEYESRRQRYMQIYAEVEEEFSEEELEVVSQFMDKLERVFRTAGDADRT